MVTAYTYADPDRELEPVKVEGDLERRWVSALQYEQVLVGGVPVDPDTVEDEPTDNVELTGGRWVTLDNGVKAYIKDGAVIAGPKPLMIGIKDTKPEPEPAPKGKKKRSASELADKWHETQIKYSNVKVGTKEDLEFMKAEGELRSELRELAKEKTGEKPLPKFYEEDKMGGRTPLRLDSPEVLAKLEEVLGPDATTDDLYKIAGATDDARDPTVHVSLTHKGHMRVRVEAQNLKLDRKLVVEEDGTKHIVNDEFKVYSGQGKGIGTRAFLSQTEFAAQAGFKEIRTLAAGNKTDPSYNGYYTWARLGYDAPIGELYDEDDEDVTVPKKFGNPQNISDLMSQPGGAEWWKSKGSSFYGKFDLSEGSRSRTVLKAYASSKGITANADEDEEGELVDFEPEITPEDEETLDKAWAEKLTDNNCGTGAGGFQPGNTCQQGGGGSWKGSLSPEEGEALGEWFGSGSLGIRHRVSSGSTTRSDGLALSAIAKAPKVSGEVYRGLSSSPGGSVDKLLEDFERAGVGGEWQDPAPHSMARSAKGAFKYANQYDQKLILRVKTKTGRDVSEAAYSSYEGEVIGLGSTRYRVSGITRDTVFKDGKAKVGRVTAIVDLEEIDEPTANNCGTGAGGFQPGNDCAKGGDGGGTAVLDSPEPLEYSDEWHALRQKAEQEKFNSWKKSSWAAQETDEQRADVARKYTKDIAPIFHGPKPPTADQRMALELYATHAFEDVNDALNGRASPDTEIGRGPYRQSVSEVSRKLDNFLNDWAGAVEPPTLYRGLQPKDQDAAVAKFQAAMDDPAGYVHLGDSYKSMTSDRYVAKSFAEKNRWGDYDNRRAVMLEVASESGVPINNIYETEYLAPRDTIYMVESIDRNREDVIFGFKVDYVKLKEVPGGTSGAYKISNPATYNEERLSMGRFCDDGEGLTVGTLDAPVDNNCGTGAGGFQPGNTCAKGSGGSDGSSSAGSGFKGEPANPKGRDTYERFLGQDGKFTPERQALHRKIIDKFLSKATPVDNPVSYMLGGGPAAGKSSALKAGGVNVPDNHVLINPDEIKDEIPEYVAMRDAGDPAAASFAHEESSYVSKLLMDEAAQGGYHLMLDGTGNNSIESLARKVQAIKEGGRKVVATYVTVDVDVAQARNLERAQKTGRLVPEAYLRATHASVSRVFPAALTMGLFDEVTLTDTSTSPPTKILSGAGRSVNINDQAAWERFLERGKD